jgi:pimeloyl-ACP methyl ester carboxylesterase
MSELSYENVSVRYEYFPCPQPNAGNIVFLHSLGLSMDEYNALLPYFLPTFNVLRYDMLGHGPSAQAPVPITIDKLADQLAYMTRRFFKGAFYVVAGPGMGYVAARFCRLYNPSVSGLVTISPQPFYLSLEEKQQIMRQAETTMTNGFHAFKQFLLSHFTIKQDSLSISHLATQLDWALEDVHLGLIHCWVDEDFGRDVLLVDSPILVLAGTQDTLFPSSLYGMTATYMKAELLMIPAAAHLVAFDNPEASAAAVVGFIAANESRRPEKSGFVVKKEDIAKALHRGFEQAKQASTQTPKPTMFVHLLHTFRIQLGDVDVTKGWNLRKVKSLFLYLLFHGGTVTRDEVIDVFWPDRPMPSARNQLRMNLHFLKSLLNQGEVEFVYTDREHIFLQKNIHCDATDYIERLRDSYSQMLRGELELRTATELLELSPKRLLTHAYDEWYLQFRDEIEDQFCALCQWISDHLQTSHRGNEAVKYDQMILDLRD